MEALHTIFGSEPFTAGEAEGVGIARWKLSQAVKAGKVLGLGYGFYAVGSSGPRRVLRRMQRDLRDRAVVAPVAVRSAADVLTVPVLGRDGPLQSPPPTFGIPPRTMRPGLRHGVRYVEMDIPPEHVMTLDDGLLITTPLRTAIDVVRLDRLPRHLALATLCGGLRIEAARVSGVRSSAARNITQMMQDPATRHALVDALGETAREVPRWGMVSVERCLAFVDPRLETALESTSWGRFVDANIPLPTPQVWLQGASGRWYCVDFWWEEFGIIGEADGMLKYRTAQDLAEEKARQLDLEAPGRSMFRWGWEHAFRTGDPLLMSLFARLRSAA